MVFPANPALIFKLNIFVTMCNTSASLNFTNYQQLVSSQPADENSLLATPITELPPLLFV